MANPDRDANFSLRLPAPMLDQLRQLAREDERSMSQFVRLVLSREIARRLAEKQGGRK